MKKRILVTISLILFGLIYANNLAFAAETKCGKDPKTCGAGNICIQTGEKFKKDGTENETWGVCKSSLDALTDRPSASKPNKDIDHVKDLPSITLESGIAVAIKAVLRTSGILIIIAIVVAAIYYVISRGKDEDLTKAKDIIVYLVIGLAIIAAAYGIVAGVTKFNVFS